MVVHFSNSVGRTVRLNVLFQLFKNTYMYTQYNDLIFGLHVLKELIMP